MTKILASILLLFTGTALLLLVRFQETAPEWFPSLTKLAVEEAFNDDSIERSEDEDTPFHFHLPNSSFLPRHDDDEADAASQHPHIRQSRNRRNRRRKLSSGKGKGKGKGSSSSSSGKGKGSKSSSSGKGKGSSSSSSSSSSCSSSSSSSISSSCDETPTMSPATSGPTPTPDGSTITPPPTFPPRTRAPTPAPTPAEGSGGVDPTGLDGWQCATQRPLPTGAVLTVELDLRLIVDIVSPPGVVPPLGQGTDSATHPQQQQQTTSTSSGFAWTSPAGHWGGGRQLKLDTGNKHGRALIGNEYIGRVTLSASRTASRFTHLTYAIDHAESTRASCGNPDNADDTVLDCLKRSVTDLNEIVADSDVAVNVGLVAWNDGAERRNFNGAYFLPPTDDNMQMSLNVLQPSGGTSLRSAMQASIQSVEDAKANDDDDEIVTPAVVLFTYGETTYEGDQADIDKLNALGATVYTFAVGPNAACTPGTSITRLTELTGGGSCIYVANPADVSRTVASTFNTQRTLDSITVTVDSVNQNVLHVTTDNVNHNGVPAGGHSFDKTPAIVWSDLAFSRQRRRRRNVRRELAPYEGYNSRGWGVQTNTVAEEESSSSSSSSSSLEEAATMTGAAGFTHISTEGMTLRDGQQRVCLAASSSGDISRCCVDVTPTV